MEEAQNQAKAYKQQASSPPPEEEEEEQEEEDEDFFRNMPCAVKVRGALDTPPRSSLPRAGR